MKKVWPFGAGIGSKAADVPPVQEFEPPKLKIDEKSHGAEPVMSTAATFLALKNNGIEMLRKKF